MTQPASPGYPCMAMHGLDERHTQGKMTWIDEEHGWGALGGKARTRRSAMTWRMQFYHERRGILACYDIDAPLPAEAVRLGWKAVLAEHPSTPRRRRPSLFERAERIGGQDASGWVLYRIAKDNEQESPGVAHPHAA
jgi:hypothetical protein